MTRAPLPDALVAIWRRTAVELEDGRHHDALVPADVRWFQARTRYADLRLPLSTSEAHDGAADGEAFGGRQHWTAPTLRFHHDLDRTGAMAEDAGTLDWDGDVLIETGVVVIDGAPCTYMERWVRSSAPHAPAWVWERRDPAGHLDGLAIRIGDEELRLTRSAAGAGAAETVCAHRYAFAPERELVAVLGNGDDPLLGPWRCTESAQ